MRTATKAYQNNAVKRACDDLIVEHLEYVRHILGKIATNLPSGVDVENLESAGVMGLVEAAHQFDESRGVAFRTFSYPRIRGAIIDELRRNCPLPQQMLQKAALIRSAIERIEPPATPESIAEESGLTLDEVISCTQAMQLTRCRSWDDFSIAVDPVGQDAPPDAELLMAENKRLLAECIEALPKQERLVVTLYYSEDLRLKEIGRVLDLSESRVSRILTKTQIRLREMVRVRHS